MRSKIKKISILILSFWIISIFLTPIHFSSHIHVTDSVTHKTHHSKKRYIDNSDRKKSENSLITENCLKDLEERCANKITTLQIVNIDVGIQLFQIKYIKSGNFHHFYSCKKLNLSKKLYFLAPKQSPPLFV